MNLKIYKISKMVTLHYLLILLRKIELEMLPHLKIGKNIFEIRQKYFRISKSVDRSTPHSDFLEEVPKSGENLVVLWWKIFVLRIV